MKKKATKRQANATSRQSTLNFPTSSEADLVAESPAAETSTKSSAKNRRKRTADFADDTDKHNETNGDSSVPMSSAPTERNKIAQGKKRSAAALGQHPSVTESPEGATDPSSSAKNRKKRTADFADNADKHNKTHCDSSAISAQSAVQNLPESDLRQQANRIGSSSRWRIEKLEQVTTKIGSGSTPRGGEAVYESQGVPLIRSMNVHSSGFKYDGLVYLNDIEAKKLDQVKVQAEDVLLNITGASIGRVTTAPRSLEGARVNQHVCIIRPNASLHAPFLAHFLASTEEQARIMNVQVGATRQALTKAMVQNWNVPVPPLPEQHRIVAEIEKQFTRLDAGVAALKRVQANLKRYRAAVLKAACEGKLVPTEAELRRTADYADIADKDMRLSASSAKSAVKMPPFETGEQLLQRILNKRRGSWQGRGQYKVPAEPDTTNLPSIPEGWSTISLDQLSAIITSGSRDWTQFYGRGTGTFVMAQNVRPGKLDLSYKLPVDPPHDNRDRIRSEIVRNDLLVTIVGANTGDVCRVPEQLTEHYVCQSVALLRPVVPEVSKYMELYLISPENGRKQFDRYIYGAGRPHLSFHQIKTSVIALPPLAEQTRIVAEVERRLSVVDELEAVVSANLQRAARLRQSILQKAFTGELV